ncbi:MAG: hypothetical protein ACTHKU_12525, partial [Verrucomicrobiota bacterium]
MEATAWPIPNWEKGRAINRVENFHYHLRFPRWVRSVCPWLLSRPPPPPVTTKKNPAGTATKPARATVSPGHGRP